MAKAVSATRPVARHQADERWLWLAKQFRSRVLPRVILIVMCALYILPFYWMVTLALKSNAELVLQPPTLFPHHLEWVNFKDAFTTIPFARFFKNTAIITVLSVTGSIISNTLIAYGFSRVHWPGRDKVFFVVLATVFVPFPVILVALFDIFAKLGWINTFLPLVVPLFFGNAFYIFLMRQFMLQLPQEVSDAAKIDGAGEFRIFAQIVLPQALPAIAVIAIISAVNAWNDFLGPLIYLQDDAKYTLSIGLQYFRSAHDIQYNLLMAASVMVVLPVVVLFFFFQRAFIEGISVGSIK